MGAPPSTRGSRPKRTRAEATPEGERGERPAPVFYGSYDWHSCVEMHWVLMRLLRAVPNTIPEGEVWG
ncbi:DUF2891 family protein [Tenggerimyces flavus]|uniref:DUF2891 family protein n=1 Tax=Tenggerimyces flavus TaxID=1708749 RepID=A0ABV7YD56_9ACTN